MRFKLFFFVFRTVYCNYDQWNGEGGALGFDLREQTTFSEEENDPLEVDKIDGKDVSGRQRRKKLRVVIMKFGAHEENVLDG